MRRSRPASFELRIQSDDACTRAIALRILWDALRGQPGVTVGDGAHSVWRDPAGDLMMEIAAEWRGADGRISIATAGAPPGREAWAEVNQITLHIANAHVPSDGPAAYLEIAEQIADRLGWKVWDQQEDRYLLPRARRASEAPPPLPPLPPGPDREPSG